MTELFIEKSKLIHGDKYDYSKVDYRKSKVNVIITCKVHGDFLQTPNNHLRSANCYKCSSQILANKKKSPLNEFIKKSNEIHGDKYDYSKVDYKNANTKIIIICKEHGDFYKTPSKHTNDKQGCAKCSGYYIPTTDEFIKNAMLVHGDKYEYSKVAYKYNNENVIITCKIHGDFLQRPGNHINSKQGCPKCGGSCKSNTIEFIEKSIKIHGDIYDYSKVNYIDATTKIIISCKIHGNFEQKPNSHLNGHGCYMCCKNHKLNTIEFIDRSNIIHNNKYDYSKVDYKYSDENIIIICKIHGEFEQTPNSHLRGSGCNKCGIIIRSNKARKTSEEFIEKARLVHGDKYDYSKVDYISRHTKIIIICKIHGEFEQYAGTHLCGFNCYKCGVITCSEKRKITSQEFIEKARLVHGDKYDYSNVDYKKYSDENIIITCKVHGNFLQTPCNHLTSTGCIECSRINSAKKRTLSKDYFIERARIVHGDKYDYSKVDYKYCDIPVIIVCKIHGEFIKTPISHYNSCRGCPKCSNNGYSKPSILWLDFLSKLYNINIQHACNDGEYVITTTKYKADGFCKENNTIYEFHGDYWHGNPKVFNLDDFNEITKCKYKELYDNTLIRENKIKELGYNLITIWENDWKKINKCVKILQQKFRKYNY
jgi:hypothetical protein